MTEQDAITWLSPHPALSPGLAEAKLILPDTPAAHALESSMLDSFGGFTADHASGAWRSPDTGRTYIEPVTVYTIAGGWQADADKLREFAHDSARRLGEESVYVSLPSGVEFVK